MKKWNMIQSAISVLSLAMMSSRELHAVQYVEATPLGSAVHTQIAPVREGTPVQLPIITWGGDIPTIHANGGVAITEKGSIFDTQGLKFKLVREDVFPKQLESYIRGETPYLRCTLGMLNQAVELLKDPRVRPVVLYQLTFSKGGDVLVVKPSIKTGADLRGKTIAIQAYGPHVDFLTTVLDKFGIDLSEVKIKWTKDLTGTAETPGEAFKTDPSIDAAFVISPDAATLTSNGAVGTGAEGSFKGARILFSTGVADTVIADVYVVRSDYFEAHQGDVQKFVHALLLAEEATGQIFTNPGARRVEYDRIVSGAGSLLLDNPKDVDGVKGLYGDAKFVGYAGNIKFFSDPNYARRFAVLVPDIQKSFVKLGLLTGTVKIADAGFDYEALKKGLINTSLAEESQFNPQVVAQIITRRSEQGILGQGEIFSFEINFEPNASVFQADQYQSQFDRVVDLATTYSGAVITVEGHSDVLPYLRVRGTTNEAIMGKQLKQAAKNISAKRANAVRESVIEFAKDKHISLDPNQFAVVGAGIDNPKTGLDKSREPNIPKTEKEWRSNMRVVFRVVPLNAESNEFTPLPGGVK